MASDNSSFTNVPLDSMHNFESSSESEGLPNDFGNKQPFYPFSKVLTLRSMQIVCGIFSLVMGCVAWIEERGSFCNLASGVFSGLATVAASCACVQTSRGYAWYKKPTLAPNSLLRILGPTIGLAVFLGFFWMVAAIANIFLLVRSLMTLTSKPNEVSETLYLVALIEAALSTAVLCSALEIARVDINHDPHRRVEPEPAQDSATCTTATSLVFNMGSVKELAMTTQL